MTADDPNTVSERHLRSVSSTLTILTGVVMSACAPEFNLVALGFVTAGVAQKIYNALQFLKANPLS